MTHARAFPQPDVSVAWILGGDELPSHVESDRPALRWGTHTRTYGELRARALGLAASLRSRGLKNGDRVAVLTYNRGETFEMYFACAYAGLTLVPINFRMVAPEMAYVLDDCGAALLLADARLAATARDAVKLTPNKIDVIVLGEDESGDEYDTMASASAIGIDYGLADPHVVLYTSGTTGRPKGAMLSHHAVMWFALQQAAFYPNMTREMVMLLTGPTYNMAAINEQSIPTFLVGGTVTIHPSLNWSPDKMARLIDGWCVTHTVVYPSMMEPFLEADKRSVINLKTLQFVLTGGENCPTATVARFRARWPHVSLGIGYGLTECGVVTYIADDDIDEHPDSVGRAFGAQTFKVVDPEGEVLPPRETGEVWTASPAMISGYWNAPELTAAAINNGWLRTGDLGWRSEDGYLYIEGRSKDMIISKGQNIYPAEIENVLSEYSELLESTIIGVPDPEFGEAVCAVVVRKDGSNVTEDDVIEFVKARLASYKKPRYVAFVDRLPRNPSEKVLKGELCERLKAIAQP